MKTPVALLVVSFLAMLCQQGCGAEIREEIYRGTPAKRGDFPYQALILSRNKTSEQYKFDACGGSLISTTYILTAGHCVYGRYESHIYLGIISAADLILPGSFYDTLFISENVVLHPKYKYPTTNDVAIIKLNREVPLSEYVKTIKLPRYSWRTIDHFKNQYATVFGFGNTYEGDNSNRILQYTKQIILGQNECEEYLQEPINDYVICTEKKKINSGPCKGDSGGPLTVAVNKEPYLVGVTSFITLNGCNYSDPAGYSNVAYFLPFIKNVTGLPYKN